MKTFLSLISITLTITLYAQNPIAALESPELNVLYRGYANKIIPAVSNNQGKTIILSSEGTQISKPEGTDYFVAKPGRDSKVSIAISLTDGHDTTFVREVEYRVSNLPDPTLYLGKSRIGSAADINATELHVKYPAEVPLKASFQITKWSITVNGETISGTGNNIKSASELLQNASDGAVVFVQLNILSSDGITRMRTGNWIVEK